MLSGFDLLNCASHAEQIINFIVHHTKDYRSLEAVLKISALSTTKIESRVQTFQTRHSLNRFQSKILVNSLMNL